jgi:hypothetical protein
VNDNNSSDVNWTDVGKCSDIVFALFSLLTFLTSSIVFVLCVAYYVFYILVGTHCYGPIPACIRLSVHPSIRVFDPKGCTYICPLRSVRVELELHFNLLKDWNNINVNLFSGGFFLL